MANDRVKIILENCKGSVLHVGCGSSGLHLRLLYSLKERLHGLDLMDYSQIYQRFVQANAEVMPYGNESFDTVILPDVLMHVYNQAIVLQECKRVLNNFGVLIVTVPNFESLWSRLFGTYNGRRKDFVRRLRRNKTNPDCESAYVYQFDTTIGGTKKLLEDNGFSVQKTFVTHLTDDVGCVFSEFGGRQLQRGWLIDFRYVLCRVLPECLREQVVFVAKKEAVKK